MAGLGIQVTRPIQDALRIVHKAPLYGKDNYKDIRGWYLTFRPTTTHNATDAVLNNIKGIVRGHIDNTLANDQAGFKDGAAAIMQSKHQPLKNWFQKNFERNARGNWSWKGTRANDLYTYQTTAGVFANPGAAMAAVATADLTAFNVEDMVRDALQTAAQNVKDWMNQTAPGNNNAKAACDNARAARAAGAGPADPLDDANKPLTCSRFMDCLNGVNVGECHEFFKTATFWPEMETEIDNMSVAAARQMLSRFNWRVGVDSYVTWVQRNGGGNAPALLGVAQLQSFLQTLNKKVTNDRDLSGRLFVGSRFASFGMKPVTSAGYAVNLPALRNAITRTYNRVALVLGHGGTGVLIGGQKGGENISTHLERRSQMLNIQPLAAEFTRIFEHLKKKLEGHGKKIQKDDVDAIRKVISDLDKNEEKLYRVMAMLARFAEMQALGTDVGPLNGNNLQKLYDNRTKRIEKTKTATFNTLSLMETLNKVLNAIGYIAVKN